MARFTICKLRGIKTNHNLGSARSIKLPDVLIPQPEVTGYEHYSLGTIPVNQSIFGGQKLAADSIQPEVGGQYH